MSTTMQNKLSEGIYGNVSYQSGRGDQFDEVYANQETASTQTCNESEKKEDKKGATTTEVRCYRVCAVSLGLLCVLLLAVIIWMVTKHTAERDQQQRNMDLLQLININLTQERDLLLERSNEKNDLIAEMEKLQRAFCWKKEFGSSFYYLSNSKKTWRDSKQDCMAEGGHLVTIDSEEEQKFIHGLKEQTWIGLNDIETEGRWKWVDGKALEKAGYWNKGEPNDESGNEDCVEILPGHGQLTSWNDLGCDKKRILFVRKKSNELIY